MSSTNRAETKWSDMILNQILEKHLDPEVAAVLIKQIARLEKEAYDTGYDTARRNILEDGF